MSSTTPLAEPIWHPVHRANAMLRAALLSSAQPTPVSDERQSLETLSRAITSVMEGPVNITFPQSLAVRLDALAAEEEKLPPFEVHRRGIKDHPAQDDWEDGDESECLGDLVAGAPLDPERGVLVPQFHVESLMHEFRRRQRRASLLVAGSIATAALLTVGGLVLIASFAAPHAAYGDSRPLLRSTSVAWQRPAATPFGLQHAAVSANRAAKGEPLLVPTLAGPVPSSASLSAPQTILAASGRQIEFGALMPPSHSGYLLIRGLPSEAALSAGRQSESGTWLVKGEHVPSLTLSIGNAAEGDYPIEVYVLQSGDGPQARRSLVLRVEASTPAYPPVEPDWGWASALLDVVPAAEAAETPAAPAESAVLRERAKRFLEEGDIAAARLLFLHLAERGEGDAAYDLARTFDREALDSLGVKGVGADLARARGWYERASQGGNVKAAERLKILASLSGTAQSD